MFNQVKCETPDLAKQKLEKLKALFPGVVTEGPDGVAIGRFRGRSPLRAR